jgi:hypothetical protein
MAMDSWSEPLAGRRERAVLRDQLLERADARARVDRLAAALDGLQRAAPREDLAVRLAEDPAAERVRPGVLEPIGVLEDLAAHRLREVVDVVVLADPRPCDRTQEGAQRRQVRLELPVERCALLVRLELVEVARVLHHPIVAAGGI